MSTPYALGALKRPVNLSLNEDLVRRVRELTPNLSQEVERLLAAFLAERVAQQAAADAELAAALVAWNTFDAEGPTLADEFSTL